MTPNCYECKHRGSLAGDCHSQCNHPKINESDRLLAPVAMVLGMPSQAMKQLDIQLDSYGVQMNWAIWPINYDPIWLKNCNGFEKKD